MSSRATRQKGKRPLFEALEDQVLFSADALGGLDAVLPANRDDAMLEAGLLPKGNTTAEAGTQQAQTPAIHQRAERQEIVFVDSSVADYESLLQGFSADMDPNRSMQVVMLDAKADGIEQMATALAGLGDVDAVHIISHGNDEGLQLGSTWLSSDTVGDYRAQLASLADRLANDADLLLYGCELAASDEGIALIDELAALTGADVAASNDLTGSALLGGDWDLEHRVGTIESALAVSAATQQSWEQVLVTYTVTNNAALGPGSLSDAIDQANASTGVNDVIEFNIGGGGAQTIVVDAAGLPVIIDTVTIDATTQPGYTGVPLITLDGSNTPDDSGINGFQVRADNSVIKGFRVHSFADEGIEIDGSTGKGDNNTIQNNWVGIDENGLVKGNAEHGIMISEFALGNQIGGTGPNEGNVVVGNGFDRGTSTDRFSGIIIQNNSDNNIVEGNVVGLMSDGDTVAGNGRYGIVIQNSSDGNRIGGIADGAENVVSGNTDDGIRIDGGTGTADNNLVQGNFIGTDAGGTQARGNGDDGISLQGGASNNTIGGTSPAERNIISGNDAAGVYIDGATTAGNQIKGNFIGTDVNGTADLGNGKVSLEGNIRTFNAGSNSIGGSGDDDGNIIAFGGSDGVELQGTTQGIAVLRNSIFANTGLAIDLNSDGADVNDGAKPGATPNLGMDTPVLSAASLSGATLNVSGHVGSAPGQALFANARVEIFKADATAGVYAQGQTYLGFLTTDANGNFSGALTVSGVLSSDRIVATATDAAGNTSEFAAALTIDVNDAPLNTVPGTQSIERDGMLVFASAAGTAISVSDPDAETNAIEVTLIASNGTLTLPSTQGLLFTTGDGADDALMTFTGTISDINSALEGMNFTATPAFTGAASVQILSDDLGSTGTGGAKTDTDLVTINVVGSAQSLWMTFENDEGSTGNADIPSISGGDVVSFGDITSLETSDSNPLASTTSGTFSYRFNLDTVLLSDGVTPASDGDTRVNAVHRVASDISVGTNSIALEAGDLLLSTDADETIDGVSYKKESVFAFRPDTAGDYSQGSFFLLIDGQAAATSFGNLTAITLVEKDTSFAGGTLNAGEFLVAFNNDSRDIGRFTPGTLGATTTGSTITLVEADDINIGQEISGLHLVQSDATLGGVSLTAGQLLVALEANDSSVGDAPTIDVKQQDVFVLDVTATGAGSSAATAHRLFEGQDENLNNNQESLWGVTLQSNAPPAFAPVAFAIDENSPAASVVGTVTATDPEGDSPRYAILAGNTGNAFAVDAASGQIVVANAAALDFEATPVFSLTVAAVDSAGAYSTATVTVNLNNVNEAPVIGGVDTGAVTEDVDPDTDTLLETAGALTITDPDAGESSFSVGTVNGTYGSLVIDSAGNWNYSADNTQAAIQQLDAGETLVDTLTVLTFDGTTHDVVITINGAEDAPVIGGTASGAVAEDGALTASDTLTITDADTSDNPVSFNNEASTPGDNGYGNFQITGNTWTYTLNNAHAAVQALDVGETLSDTHTFTASDGSTQVVTITINGAEDAPVIGGTATGAVAEDGTLTASDALTITDADTSDNPVSFNNEPGTLGDNGYGNFAITGNTWTYTLNNAHASVQALDVGETLSDTHTFTASDGSTQVVTITINGAEDAPVIGGTATGAVAEDGTLTASNSLTITDTDTSDNPVSFNNEASTLGDNGYGSFAITGNTWTYTLNNAHAAVQALDVGETLSDSYTFTASDSSTQVVTITINGAEDASVIGGTASGAVAEDGTLTASDTLTITDADTSDNPVSFNNEPGALGDNGYGNFQITGNTWTYTLNNVHAAVQALDVGETLSDTHTFTASDGSTQVVTITINGAEDAPVIGGTATGAVAEDGTLTASNALTITDTDTSDNPVSFNNEASTLGDNGYGNFQITGNTWTYTLNNAHAAVQALDVGETLSDTHTFTASDGSTQVVTITINGAEDASVIGGTASGAVAEDGTLTASDTLTITDVDTSDNPVSFNNEPSTPGDNGYGNFQITGNTWTYTLNNAHASVQALDVGETLSDTHTFTASDGSTQVVAITINGAEDAPVIGGTATGAVAEDGTLSASDTLTITDTDTSDNPVSFNNEASTPGDNGYGNFQITGNTWTYTLNNAHASVQALDVGETLSDTHTFTASDGSTQVVTITINGAEDAPVIGGTASGAVAEDGALTASDTLTITDADTSDNPVSFNNEASTPGDNGYGNFAITGNTWTYTLNNAHASVQALDVGETLSDTHTFTASDGSTQVVTITINGAEDAPVIGGTASGAVTEDGTLTASDSLTITDTDTSDNPISFNNEASTPGDSGFGSFAITGNTWTYTLNNAHATVQALDVGETLNDSHTFTASDGSTQVVTITINGAEDAPVIGGTASGAVAEDGTLTASDTLTITDADTSDNPVSFNNEASTPGDNGYGNFAITGNTWTYTLNNAHASVQALDVGETLSDTHTFTASDGSTQVVTITINGAEDAPVIGGTASGAVTEDGTLTASDTLTITDADTSDNPVSFNDEPGTPGDNGYGNFAITGNTWTYTLNNAHATVQALDVGETLSDSHTFTASDGSTQVVTITINGAEDAPVLGGTATGAVTEDGTLTASDTLTITDTDTSDNPVSFNNEPGTLGDNGFGNFQITGNTWTYTLNNAHATVQALDVGETLSDTHTFTASDGSTQVVTITINGAEDAPVLGGTATGAVTEDGTLTASDTLTITDTDTSDNPVSFNNEPGTPGDNGFGNFQITGNTWTYTLNNAHATVQALDVGETLSDTHTFTASDGSTQVVTITINGAEDAPVIGGTATGAVTEDGTLTASDTLTITDTDTSDNPVSFNDEPGTLGDNGYGSFAITGNTWTYTLNNAHASVQALDVGETLSDTHIFTASDGSTQAVTITINGAEDAPVIGGTATGAVAEDGTLTASDTLTITDADTSDNPVSFNNEASTPGDNGYGSFAITGNTWTYTLNNAHASVQALDVGETLSDTYTFTASDGSTQVVTITINGAEDAPVLGGTATGAVTEDGALTASDTLTITDADTSDNPVSFNDETSTPGDNGYGDFAITSNVWTFTLNNAHAAVQALGAGASLSDTHTFTASDGSLQVVTVTIDGNNDTAVVGGVNSSALTEDIAVLDGKLATSAALTIFDVDAGESQFQAATVAGTYGSLSIDAAGNWSYSADNSQFAIQELTAGQSVNEILSVSTADGAVHTITITISGAEDVDNNATDPLDEEPEPPGYEWLEEIIAVATLPATSPPADDGEPTDNEPNDAVDAGLDTEPFTDPLATAQDQGNAPQPLQVRPPVRDAQAGSAPGELYVAELFQAAERSADTAAQVETDDNAPNAENVVNKKLLGATQTMRDEMSEAAREEQFAERAADAALRVSATAISAGSLAWLLRGASMFASALSAVPTWTGFDPLPVLAKSRRSRKDPEPETKLDEDEREADVGEVLDSLAGADKTDSRRGP